MCVKIKKINVLLNAREFYKRWREILIGLEENTFPLLKPYVFGENEWNEKYLGDEKFKSKTFKLTFLQEYNQTPLSEKERELLNRDFGYKDIDELAFAFNNTKTDEERDELFHKIVKLSTLKKLVKMVSSETERKRINNVIKSVKFS